MNKLVTFVNDTKHENVEELSFTYNSAIFFSENQENMDIYTGTYLYSYIQGVNTNKDTVLWESGQFKIRYNDDKLCSSYIYMSDKDVTIYPSMNPDFASQNEYEFKIYHSSDVNIDKSKIIFDDTLFNLNDNKLILKDNRINSTETKLKYLCNNGNYITTNIHIIRNKPEFDVKAKNIVVRNNSVFDLPFSLINNKNHEKLTFTVNDNSYVTHVKDLQFRAKKETDKNSYISICSSINNVKNYTYVTIEPSIKAESIGIVPINNNSSAIASKYSPYESSFNNANTGSSNIFKIIFSPKNPTNKNVKWYSTDPSTMQIIGSNNQSTVTVRYLKPGKVILYAMHEYKNDNELRAIMIINITGSVLITDIQFIKIIKDVNNPDQVMNTVTDGDPMIFCIHHAPADSELSLVFDEGEEYIDDYRKLLFTTKTNTCAYSYFLTYANVDEWEENISQINPSFSLSYYRDGNFDNFTHLNQYFTINKLYSDYASTFTYVNNNSRYYSIPNSIYKGDVVSFVSYFAYYPRTIDLSNLSTVSENSYNMTYGNNIKFNASDKNIKAINGNIIERGDNLHVSQLSEGLYTLNTDFSYQYNIKNITGLGSYTFTVSTPKVSIRDKKNITYNYTGSLASYILNPDRANIIMSSPINGSVTFENGNIKFNNPVNTNSTVTVKYTIKNNEYTSGINNFDISIIPVEIIVEKDGVQVQHQYTHGMIDDVEASLNFTYNIGPDNALFKNKSCTYTVDNGTPQPLVNNQFTITKSANEHFSSHINNIRKEVKIINDASGCEYKFNVIFTLDRVYITNMNVTLNKDLYYNSNGNQNYTNDAMVIFDDLTFSTASSAITTNITLEYDTDYINVNNGINLSSSNITTVPTNNTLRPNLHVHTRQYFDDTDEYFDDHNYIKFTYESGANSTGTKTIKFNSFMLPYEASLTMPANELYENLPVLYNVSVRNMEYVSPNILNQNYSFINTNNNLLLKNDTQLTLRNLNGISTCPIVKYSNTYGIYSMYTNTGQEILNNYDLYLMYTYFSYYCDPVYYGLNNPTKLTINAYINSNNLNKFAFDYVSDTCRGFNEGAFTFDSNTKSSMTYNGKTLDTKYNKMSYTLDGNKIQGDQNDFKLGITYNGTTYLYARGPIYKPTISLDNPDNNIITYTNGNDSTNWIKSFPISYQKQSDWPTNYNGNWSYWYNGSLVTGNDGKYAPTNNSNGGKQFYVKCDNIKSNERKIFTHTLCDNFQLDTDKSYLPIVVASSNPYTIYNKYQGVSANNSSVTIDIAPDSYVATSNTSKFTCNDKTITYQSVSDDYQREVTITYSCGHFNNLTTKYPVYTINYGFTNLSLMRTQSTTLSGYINGITGASLQFSTNTGGASISGNTLSFSGVSSSSVGQNIPVNIICSYPAQNNKNYKFNSTQNVKVLPYRLPSFNYDLFTFTVSNMVITDSSEYFVVNNNISGQGNVTTITVQKSVPLMELLNGNIVIANLKVTSGEHGINSAGSGRVYYANYTLTLDSDYMEFDMQNNNYNDGGSYGITVTNGTHSSTCTLVYNWENVNGGKDEISFNIALRFKNTTAANNIEYDSVNLHNCPSHTDEAEGILGTNLVIY